MHEARIRELISAADLESAINVATQHLKSDPTDETTRISLFQLLCFAGEFERAEKQINIVEQQRSKNDLSVQVYKNCLRSAEERVRVYAGDAEPYFFYPPPDYVDLQIEAMKAVRKQEPEKAKSILKQAEEKRPKISGRRNGKLIKDFRDWDDFTAPILEVFVHDKYAWLPFEQIRTLDIRPPQQLRDLIWTSAKIESVTGIQGEVIVPTLYDGTAQESNPEIRMGRKTEWHLLGDDVYCAVGLRIFLADAEEIPIFELNKIEFDTVVKD